MRAVIIIEDRWSSLHIEKITRRINNSLYLSKKDRVTGIRYRGTNAKKISRYYGCPWSDDMADYFRICSTKLRDKNFFLIRVEGTRKAINQIVSQQRMLFAGLQEEQCYFRVWFDNVTEIKNMPKVYANKLIEEQKRYAKIVKVRKGPNIQRSVRTNNGKEKMVISGLKRLKGFKSTDLAKAELKNVFARVGLNYIQGVEVLWQHWKN